MATEDFTTNNPTRFPITNGQNGRNMKIQIASPGVVFHLQGAARPSQVVPAASGWTVPSVQHGPIRIDIET